MEIRTEEGKEMNSKMVRKKKEQDFILYVQRVERSCLLFSFMEKDAVFTTLGSIKGRVHFVTLP